MKAAEMKNKAAGQGVFECGHCHCVTTYVVLCARCLANPYITAGYFDSALPARARALREESRSHAAYASLEVAA